MSGTKAFATTIKSKWWDQKVTDAAENSGVFYEYKEDKPHWNKRLEKLTFPAMGVFLEGSIVHRVAIIQAVRGATMCVPRPYVEAVNTPTCWRIKCVMSDKEIATSIIRSMDRKKVGINKSVAHNRGKSAKTAPPTRLHDPEGGIGSLRSPANVQPKEAGKGTVIEDTLTIAKNIGIGRGVKRTLDMINKKEREGA